MSRFVRTHKARKIFLDQLSVGNSLSFAAHAAGATVRNFKRWREDDENFSQDWDEAIEEGTDFIEDVALDRAMKKSDPLMQMILKARRPDKYDRGSKLELSGGINVEGSKAKLLNRIARLQAQGDVSSSDGEEKSEALGNKSPETPLLPAPASGKDGSRPIRGSKRRAAVEGSGRKKAAQPSS